LKSVVGLPGMIAWRKRALAFLAKLEDRVTACDLFDFYFCYSTGDRREPYSYYAFRFGQPRHLVALSLSHLIDKPKKPVLELGCGFGHITRHLLARARNQPVIALDTTFFCLYVAKYWLAPGAEYVCADADSGLPFADHAFSSAFCSDAFHWFTGKAICARELKRVTNDDQGLIILATLRNGLLEQDLYHGTLPPDHYQALFTDLPHQLLSNAEILARYLEKQGPPLAQSTQPDRLASEPWLSLVASRRKEMFEDYGVFDDWPHAEGRLALNPLYQRDGESEPGELRLRHIFPSSWYAKEDGQCRSYEPETVSISSDALVDLNRGNRTSAIEQLIARCIVIGLPERFL
jgi:SAM-dependent methyltransferase